MQRFCELDDDEFKIVKVSKEVRSLFKDGNLIWEPIFFEALCKATNSIIHVTDSNKIIRENSLSLSLSLSVSLSLTYTI